ncbi:hypothetical protein DMO17_06540 [Aquipseudomonas alcaligenes]|uniref:Uncharacterized protein n=1 Tax=Aquipseudomonas alcaligenes TaxID=43263 RepID=A0A2V4L9T6_AQUAC|nr:hypothetical protein [Pseudomonas alcaligenes]PYC27394.1 hypothetical protein DMO17_06540 [Pseudomonas alcaligenes]
MSLTVSFGRYLFWLLGEWTIPVVIGITLGTGLCLWQLTETADLLESSLTRSIHSVVESCTAPTDPPPTASPPASVTGPPVAGDGGDTG